MGERRRNAIRYVYAHCAGAPEEIVWDYVMSRLRISMYQNYRESAKVTMRAALSSIDQNCEFNACARTSKRGRTASIKYFSEEVDIIYSGLESGIDVCAVTIKVNDYRIDMNK